MLYKIVELEAPFKPLRVEIKVDSLGVLKEIRNRLVGKLEFHIDYERDVVVVIEVQDMEDIEDLVEIVGKTSPAIFPYELYCALREKLHG